MSAPTLQTVMDLIDGRTDDLVALTQDLIRFPTINPPGEAYRPCAEYIGERLKKRGFTVEYVRGEGSPGDSDQYPRTNVIARWTGSEPGPCVHFNSHIDVVEVGAGWTVDPFGGEVKDGRVYGRGACDMKGGLAASIIAVEALIDSGLPLPGALEISGTVDEESGGYGGVAYLAERGWFSEPRVNHVIIPEPLNVDRVCIGHRGVWWAEIETKGRIAHGSMPFLGDSAIRHMGAVMEEFESKLYPAMAARHSDMPVVPEGARQSTMNINSIHGGQAEGFDGLAAQRHGFRYEMRDLFQVAPSMADRDGPVASTTAAAIETVLGKKAQFVCSPGTYDQKHIDRIGKLKDCIAYGPGVLDLAHQPDEWVGIDDMTNSAKVMARAAYDLLTRKRS